NNSAVPSLPTIRANPPGRVPINGKKLDELARLSLCVVGYNFYSKLQRWASSDPKVQIHSENSDNGSGKE
ncbi:hypothetical protein L9F63_018097, partial [Diploptera punctata]